MSAESLGGRRKVLTMSHVHSSIQVHLLPEDLWFENGGAKLSSYPGRHLTSLRPCQTGDYFRQETHPLTFMLQNCGLTNCTVNSPETSFSFSFWRLVKS